MKRTSKKETCRLVHVKWDTIRKLLVEAGDKSVSYKQLFSRAAPSGCALCDFYMSHKSRRFHCEECPLRSCSAQESLYYRFVFFVCIGDNSHAIERIDELLDIVDNWAKRRVRKCV